jgi:hypothetical protein
MQANDIVTKLGLRAEDVVAIYLVGSRLWGTSTVVSDFDIIVVVEGSVSRQSLSRGKYDATILGTVEFSLALQVEGDMLLGLCNTLPPENIIKERWHPPPLNKKAAVQWLSERLSKDIEKAAKYRAKGKNAEADKIDSHSRRIQSIGSSIAS